MRKWLENQGQTLSLLDKNQIIFGSGKKIVQHSSFAQRLDRTVQLAVYTEVERLPGFPTAPQTLFLIGKMVYSQTSIIVKIGA